MPSDAYVAMDYNLNWLCAALMWAKGDVGERTAPRAEPGDGIDLDDNSDCDLMVAFARGRETHIVLLEAKGFLPFGTSVLKHKADRLKAIFGDLGGRFPHVVPHWVFVGPKPPPSLDAPDWLLDPATKKLRYVELPQPASHKFALMRCDAQGKKKDAGHWLIRSDPWPGAAQGHTQ